ncbi:hypothetical protein CYMTET_52932, partial [Cymbomonas tetramitiformis]
VHAHALGTSVWMESPGIGGIFGTNNVTLMERSPQLPQGFVPVDDVVIQPGQRVRVTCRFNSTGLQHEVHTGAAHTDEMCNLYFMFFAPAPLSLECDDAQFRSLIGAEVGDPHHVLPGIPTMAMSPSSDGDQSPPSLPPDGGHISHNTPIEQATILLLDPATLLPKGNGFGQGLFYMPHGLTVDSRGDIWVTDCGLHQVIKLTQTGEVTLSVGERLQPGKGSSNFCMPTHVAVTADGAFFVADGYCNSRIVHFSASGEFLKELGGGGEVTSGMSVPHSVVLSECERRMYVADRENARILVLEEHAEGASVLADFSAEGGLVYALALRGPALLALVWPRDVDGAATPWLAEFPADTDLTALPPNQATREGVAAQEARRVLVPGIKTPHDLAVGGRHESTVLIAETRFELAVGESQLHTLHCSQAPASSQVEAIAGNEERCRLGSPERTTELSSWTMLSDDVLQRRPSWTRVAWTTILLSGGALLIYCLVRLTLNPAEEVLLLWRRGQRVMHD